MIAQRFVIKLLSSGIVQKRVEAVNILVTQGAPSHHPEAGREPLKRGQVRSILFVSHGLWDMARV
jgi:hypothetical protein